MIEVEKIGGRIAVRFPYYNRDYVKKVKTINGCRWNLKEKYLPSYKIPDDNQQAPASPLLKL